LAHANKPAHTECLIVIVIVLVIIVFCFFFSCQMQYLGEKPVGVEGAK